jgi:TrpR family transcriptional regulator, trp operon repressor
MVLLEDALIGLRNPDEAREFMAALFSPSERDAFQNRWQAFQLLLEGVPQRAVAEQLGIGVATASRAAAVVRSNPGIIKTLLTRRKKHVSTHLS